MTELAWIVRAEWQLGAPTYHGPWETAQQAQDWATEQLDADDACVQYYLAVLNPPAITATEAFTS